MLFANVFVELSKSIAVCVTPKHDLLWQAGKQGLQEAKVNLLPVLAVIVYS